MTARERCRGGSAVVVAVAAAWLCMAGGAASATGLQVMVADEPRAFGWQVGDVLSRSVSIDVPEGLTLDDRSLPQAGGHGLSFELRRATWAAAPRDGARRHRLTLTYQIFRSPPEVRTLELPPVTLRFEGRPRAQDLRIDAWPVTVAPLVPVEVSPRRGLGEMQPDAEPPLVDTSASRIRLQVVGALSLPLLAWLAHVYLGAPWLARRQRPFECAWRALRSQPATAPTRATFRQLHEALNRSAGQILFEHGIDDFLAAQPRYAGHCDDLRLFFEHSRREFFGTAPAAGADPAAADLQRWLRDFCRRCRDTERGAA